MVLKVNKWSVDDRVLNNVGNLVHLMSRCLKYKLWVCVSFSAPAISNSEMTWRDCETLHAVYK